jgi:hypothetical protein
VCCRYDEEEECPKINVYCVVCLTATVLIDQHMLLLMCAAGMTRKRRAPRRSRPMQASSEATCKIPLMSCGSSTAAVGFLM